MVQPSIEALQEFKIQTNAYSAEFGRSSGAVVNATIKSGSNTLRGSVYGFLRNDALDANNFFSKLLGAPKPKRERNQFGGAAGGPLVRNRTFWFADYEGLSDLEGVPRVRQLPTAAEKAGLFSTAVFDPFAPGRPEFSRNAQGQWVIPRDRWDPVAAAIINMIPDPNVPGSTIFPLKDAAAIVHPSERLVAYHFFWDDDIDFPDDNDPCDHELVWVRYSADGASLERLWTYFHGRILDGGDAALADARAARCVLASTSSGASTAPCPPAGSACRSWPMPATSSART